MSETNGAHDPQTDRPNNMTIEFEPLLENLIHTRSCPSLIPGHEEDCTCGLVWRIRLRTEIEMRNAWEKRAYEAEKQLNSRESTI